MELELITFTLICAEEHQPGKGEDALNYRTGESNAAIIACMDGCGGSGGCRYPQFENQSGARIASRLVEKTVIDWFDTRILPEEGGIHASAQDQAEDLARWIKQREQEAAAQLDPDQQTLISSLARIFPTTLAAMTVEVIEKNNCRIRSFWAGDSRTYFFPVSGLQQTSRDNTRGNLDPFDDLIRDGIMDNVICADRPFHICWSELYAQEPCMILTATDGCFSYFVSPMYLECILLETLESAETPREWEKKLREIFASVAGDDFTLVLAVIGFQNFPAIKAAYSPRWETFQLRYAAPLEEILVRKDIKAHRDLWEIYKREFMPENRGKGEG